MRIREIAAITAAALSIATSAHAQKNSPYPYPVQLVTPQRLDQVGNQLAYTIRQKLALSSTLALREDAPVAIQIILHAMDPNEGVEHGRLEGLRTTYAVVWTFRTTNAGTAYLDSAMGSVGSQRIESAADRIVANTDEIVRSLLASARGENEKKEKH